MLEYMDDHFGLIHRESDMAYVMNELGDAIWVPFGLPNFYWQEH